MPPRRPGFPSPEERSSDPTAWFVGIACTLVLGLFVAMTAGGAWFGYARPEGHVCPVPCR